MVAADDRTGAFEVAALFAQVVGPVTVTVGEASSGSGVVDLGTRAMSASDARRIASTIDASPSTWVAHKTDSTLRGNWAVELLARQRATGRRVVLLPGWPELGRTCVGGVVFVDGLAIGDVRDHLADADLVSDANQLRAWLSGTGTIAVCDVPDSQAMHAEASALVGHDILLAGPAGPLGAAFAAGRVPLPTARAVDIVGPVLVVCGSANPVSREQLRRLRVARPDVEVIAADVPDGELHARALDEVAVHARRRREFSHTLVIIGGDTAAAVLGDVSRVVAGFAAPGMPFLSPQDGSLVITKAGGFGRPDALVDLLRGENG